VSNSTEPILRPAARVVILDEADRVLLVRFEDAARGAHWWAAPGGALKSGESHDQAITREIHEETGLSAIELVGPWIWTREHVFELKRQLYRQQERFFLARSAAFEAVFTQLEEEEKEFVRELRWWTAAELEETEEELSPRNLPNLLRGLLKDGPPRSPIEVGI
jgi:ADP-ribose pyrophosphatase YjhB (NUDIX family)